MLPPPGSPPGSQALTGSPLPSQPCAKSLPGTVSHCSRPPPLPHLCPTSGPTQPERAEGGARTAEARTWGSNQPSRDSCCSVSGTAGQGAVWGVGPRVVGNPGPRLGHSLATLLLPALAFQPTTASHEQKAPSIGTSRSPASRPTAPMPCHVPPAGAPVGLGGALANHPARSQG